MVPLRKQVLKYGTPKPSVQSFRSAFRGRVLSIALSEICGFFMAFARPVQTTKVHGAAVYEM